MPKESDICIRVRLFRSIGLDFFNPTLCPFLGRDIRAVCHKETERIGNKISERGLLPCLKLQKGKTSVTVFGLKMAAWPLGRKKNCVQLCSNRKASFRPKGKLCN